MSEGQEPGAAAQAAQAHIADLLDRLIALSPLERAEAVLAMTEPMPSNWQNIGAPGHDRGSWRRRGTGACG